MCGIAGWINWDRDLTRQKPVLEAMGGTLANRGPDAEGFWYSRHAAFAHRRLVVVDPAGGAQPMVRRRGGKQCVLVYNGELYNTPDLRGELEARGYSFHGHSDTEVLLVSYLEWGEKCVELLNGIFAFAVWNEAEEKLFLARDRLGVKPLFYSRTRDGLIFGSELKALLAHPEIQPAIDARGLAEVLVMCPGRTPGHGVFRGIDELKPGYCLSFKREGMSTRRYWKLESKPHTDDLDTTVEKVRALFQDAVVRQLVADVPVCTLLSGGIDSSAITAYAAEFFQREGREPIHTYSIDYVDNERYFKSSLYQPNSDAWWVEKVSKRLGTVHHQVLVDTPELVDSLEMAVRARDLPGMADVDSSLYLFCREIKKDATVALSGECADEIFGGYPWFHNPDALNDRSFPWVHMFDERMQLLAPEIVEMIKPREYLDRRYRETLADVPRYPEADPREYRVRELLYLTTNWFMATLLDRKDRMSMAVGLEVRVPFSDHRLMEYVWNIPWDMKNAGGMEKGVFRRAMAGVVPGEVLSRRKSPYPKTHHPAYTGAVRDRLKLILEDHSSPLLPLIDAPRVWELLASGGATITRPWYGQLMTGPQLFAYFIQLDTWLREYKVSIK